MLKLFKNFILNQKGTFTQSAAVITSIAIVGTAAIVDQHVQYKDDLKSQVETRNAVQSDDHNPQADQIDARVLGGKDARKKDFTFIAAIRSEGFKDSWCTGAVVSDYHIITAAHCVKEYDPNKCNKTCLSDSKDTLILDIGAYENQYRKKHPNKRPRQLLTQKKDIESVVIHPDYNKFSLTHDIAVITTKTKIRDDIDRAFIKGRRLTKAERKARYMAAGFGVQTLSGRDSDYPLTYHNTRMLRKDECQILSTLAGGNANDFRQDQICTSNLPRVKEYIKSDIQKLPTKKELAQTSTSGCAGDSGSPLFSTEKLHTRRVELDKKYRLMGVLSWAYHYPPDGDYTECSGLFDGYAEINRNIMFLRANGVPIHQ